jgi:hypothetical protein
MQNALLNINPEGNLLKEVKDILDELHIMIRIQLQQQAVATSFVDRIKRLLQPKIIGPDPWAEMLNGSAVSVEDQSKRREEFQNVKRTVARADGLVNDIQDRIAELKTLEESANDTSTAVSIDQRVASNASQDPNHSTPPKYLVREFSWEIRNT